MNEFKSNLKGEFVRPLKVENTKDAIYVCGICGKPYSTIEDRMACEKKCYDERKKAEEALRKQKLTEERETRKAEIEAKTAEAKKIAEELSELTRAFLRDYGYLHIHSNVDLSEGIFDFDKMFGEWF